MENYNEIIQQADDVQEVEGNRLLHGVLYGDSDAINDGQKSLTTTTQMTNYSRQSEKKLQAASSGKVLPRAAGADTQGASGNGGPYSSAQSSTANSGVIIGGQMRQDSGNEATTPLMNSTNNMFTNAVVEAAMDQQDAAFFHPSGQFESTTQSNGGDRYHNRQQSYLYPAPIRDQTSASAQNLGLNQLKQSNGGQLGSAGNSILVSAGQHAATSIANNSQHHIPIRNVVGGQPGAVDQLQMQSSVHQQLINRGPSSQSTHHSNSNSQPHQQFLISNNQPSTVSATMSQQQLQQQQYKTAKTQMYEKMIIQHQQQIEKKSMIFASNTANASFNQAQIAAAQALSSQHHFLTNQNFNNGYSQQQQQQQQQTSLLFPRIGNIRNNENAGIMYKTSTQNQPLSNAQPGSNLQSPFLQTQKQASLGPSQAAIQNGLIVASSIGVGGGKKKTVSPRNMNNGVQQAMTGGNQILGGGAKMLLLADKNQQLTAEDHAMSMIEQSESKNGQGGNTALNRNRLKSTNYNAILYNGKKEGPSENHEGTDIISGSGKSKEYYNTEKFGQTFLMSSDSHTALQPSKVQNQQDEASNQGQNQQQFYVGEMSITGDYAKKAITSEEAANLYQQAVTPSIMSSHSNKRQSHHIQIYNQNNNMAAGLQDPLQHPTGQNNANLAHNFFSRRTVSNKEQSVGSQSFKQPHSQPISSHHHLQIQQYSNAGGSGGIHQGILQDQHFSSPVQYSNANYPFSPVGGAQTQYPRSGGIGAVDMVVDGSQLPTGDPRMKFAVSVAGIRASHDNSPIKQHHALHNFNNQGSNVNKQSVQESQITQANGSDGNTPGQQMQSNAAVANGDQQQQQQQPVKIPVICGFHKRVLLLTSQITTQGGVGVNPAPGTAIQPARESINKKIRNRNPNCNHNNNSVFYAPCYNNVKYDDSYKKKEEVLRKVFFKECAREDEKRNFTSQPSYFPNSTGAGAMQPFQQYQPKSNDPFTYLKPIENFLIQTLFVEYDHQQALKLNPNLVPTRLPIQGSTLFMELGLEQAIVAHKAFLLALIQSGKITNENMLKVLHEFKSSAIEFDHECIYCKYSQYALRESTKVIRNNMKAALTDGSVNQDQTNHAQSPQISGGLYGEFVQQGQEPRIEYLIRMFQSQLFKRSFINTSLMIIQRKMNEKLLQKQRLPPGIGPGGQPLPNGGDQLAKQKKPLKNGEKKGNTAPLSSLDWIGQQMQKLAKNLSNPKDKDKYLELKEKYYREFLMKINLSNSIVIPFPKQTFTPYKYYIGKGNNSILVRNCLKQRFWWSMGDFDEWDEYNFIWTQWKANKIIAKIKTNNEANAANTDPNATIKSGMSGKDGVVVVSDSMLSTDRDSNSSAETLLATPTKRKRVATALQTSLQNSSLPIKKNTSASKTNVLSKAATVVGAANATTDDGKDKKETSHGLITYNHMENNYHLSNKKALYYNMKIYYESTGQDWCSVLPLTFHIKEGPTDKEFQRFVELFKDYDSGKGNPTYEKLGKSIWIVKPGENTNRGCGIQVCKELSQIKEIVSNTNVNGQKRSYIIQKYIEKPLLYKNRKFDIRCYTLLTTVNGNLQGYWYNEGYLRTSSKDFNLKNVTNRLIHLTNDAVQKKSDDYGKFESGNKLSYPDFQKYLDSVDNKCNFVKEIVPQLKKMASDTIKACSRKVDPHRRHNTFEIFGYDFMIDEEMKPWLIEVNTNPCLELSAPYLSRLIPTMIENAVKIAVDPLFPPPPWPNAKKHMIPDCLENNKFELVFNELSDGAELKALPIDDVAMNGIIEEEEMEDEGSENDGDDDFN